MSEADPMVAIAAARGRIATLGALIAKGPDGWDAAEAATMFATLLSAIAEAWMLDVSAGITEQPQTQTRRSLYIRALLGLALLVTANDRLAGHASEWPEIAEMLRWVQADQVTDIDRVEQTQVAIVTAIGRATRHQVKN